MILAALLQTADAQTSPQPLGRSQWGRAAAPALPCLWGSQIQTVVPAVSERRLLGAEGDEAWMEFWDAWGLAFPLPASGGVLDPPGGAGLPRLQPPKGSIPCSGVAEPRGRRDPSAPSIRHSREPRSKR